MRKASREMPAEWALEVMRKAPYITVSFTRPDGTAYGVPLSLASASNDIWYFHCAPEGDKLEAIAAHPEVCLSAVTQCRPTVGPKDGSFTLQYRSAIAFGRAEVVHQPALPAPTHGGFRRGHPPQPAPHGGSAHHAHRAAHGKTQTI